MYLRRSGHELRTCYTFCYSVVTGKGNSPSHPPTKGYPVNITPELLADYGDYLLDEPGAAVPPPAGMSRVEYLIGAPILALTVVGVPLYLAGHVVAALF